MPRALISLYVLLTTPIAVPWTILMKGAAVVLAYAVVLPFEAQIGIDAVNLAVLAGLIVGTSRRLSHQLEKRAEMPNIIGWSVAIIMGFSALALYVPAPWLPYLASAGWGGYALLYAIFLTWDRPFLEKLGWPQEKYGVEGQANLVRWTILRNIGLAVANMYAAIHGSQTEWIVAYAALPALFYLLYSWSVIATHPLEDKS